MPGDLDDLRGDVRSIWRRAVRNLWRSFPDVVLFELLFQAVTLLLLSPLVAWLFRSFVATSGAAAVGNFDVIRFLVSPWGLALGVPMLTLALALGFGNVAGLVYIAYGAGYDRRVSYWNAAKFVARRLTRLLSASFLVLLVLAATALPFVGAVGLIAWWLLGEHDINFYLEVRPTEFWQALGLGAALLVGAVVAVVLVAVPLVFVLPESLLADRLGQSLRASYRLARGHSMRILLVIVGWLLAWQFSAMLLNGALYWLGRVLVRWAGERLAVLLTTLGALTSLSVVLNYLLVLVAVALGCGLLAQLYLLATRERTARPATLAWLPALDETPTWSVPRKAPLVMALVMLGLATVVVQQVLATVRWEDRVENSAHRGASLAKPENTLGAIRRAIEDGATYIEIDVQLTRDGRVVIVHDADMKRMARSPLVINRSTYEELRALEFSGEHVATLDEAIELARGKAKLMVEYKTYRSDPIPLIETVIKLLRDHDMLDQAVVMSLEYNEARETKRREPRLDVGFVTSARLGDLTRLDVDFLAVIRGQANNTLVASAHAAGKRVFVWTIDDRPGMATMIDRGVDGIITNDPALLTQVLRERRALEPAERLLLRFRALYID